MNDEVGKRQTSGALPVAMNASGYIKGGGRAICRRAQSALRCDVPYRIDLTNPPPDTLTRLADLGALDVDQTPTGLAAVMPDSVDGDALAGLLGVETVRISPAIGRDDGSVWILTPRPVQVGRLLLLPSNIDAPPDARVVRLTDGPAFGTGLHPTTALCLEILEDELLMNLPLSMLDVGVGSGVLALAALAHGVEEAVGIDIDADALAVAEENARLNDMAERLRLILGSPEDLDGTWTLVFANVLAAPLLDMAPSLVRRLGHRGRLVLSGISWSLSTDVERTYQRLGMRTVRTDTRCGWSAIVMESSW